MRKQAREISFLLTYEYLFLRQINEDTQRNLFGEFKLPEEDFDFVRQNIYGIAEKYEELKTLISSLSKNFAFDRIYKTDLAVLLLASYELLFTDTPEKAVIDEALRIAAKYCSEKSKSYINGVLAGVAEHKTNGKNYHPKTT